MNDELTVTFRFRLQQDVQIIPLKLTGRVLARCDRGEGLTDYRVIFWADNTRHDEWLYEHELSELKTNGNG